MSDPAVDLQAAIAVLLKADADVTAIINGRVYDDVPVESKRVSATGKAFPYLSFGASQILPDIAEGYDGADEILTIDGWSVGFGYIELKRLGRALNAALTGATLTISGMRVIEIVPEQAQYLRDQDGITRHGVFPFRFRTEPAT